MSDKIDIHPTARIGDNVTIMGDLTLGENVEVGANVTLYPNVTIGAGTRILPGAVIGRAPVFIGALSMPIDESIQPVIIGEQCVIGANAVLYTNLIVGNNTMISDLASVREGGRIGNSVVLGRLSALLSHVTVGDRTLVHDGVHLTGGMLVESDVFLGPLACSVNDNSVYTQRFSEARPVISPPVARRFSLIGAHATLSAGVEVGEGAIVAPAAMVTRDVEPWTVVAGVPARLMRLVDDGERESVLRSFGLDAGDGA